jgi:hypothetical protein
MSTVSPESRPQDSVADSVPDAVKWGSSSILQLARSHEQFKLWSAQRLGHVIGVAIQQGIEGASALAADIDSISTNALSRVLLAPKVSCRIGWTPADSLKEHIAYLRRCVHVERVREGSTEPCLAAAAWSAIGDFYCSATPLPMELRELLVPATGTGSACCAYNSRSFGPGIPFDLSPDHVAGDGLGEADPLLSRMTATELGRLIAALDVAFELVSKVNERAQWLVRTFTRTVVVRKLRAEGFGSSSTLSYPGRTLLINPLNEGVSTEMLAESLVHEAIHSYIYEMEAVDWWTRDDHGCTVRSPWSGNILTLHAFVHASFVWFGLAQFWMDALRRDLVLDAVLEARICKCVQGFLVADIPSMLLPFSDKLRVGLIDVIRLMQSEIRDLFPP